MNTKQVIIIRKDLKMRRGKECAQAAHAAMAFLTKRIKPGNCSLSFGRTQTSFYLQDCELAWLANSFKKITLQVDNKEELLEIYKQAKSAGLESHLIQDNGLTEFGGQITETCVAIGPDEDSKIDKITGHLRLY